MYSVLVSCKNPTCGIGSKVLAMLKECDASSTSADADGRHSKELEKEQCRPLVSICRAPVWALF